MPAFARNSSIAIIYLITNLGSKEKFLFRVKTFLYELLEIAQKYLFALKYNSRSWCKNICLEYEVRNCFLIYSNPELTFSNKDFVLCYLTRIFCGLIRFGYLKIVMNLRVEFFFWTIVHILKSFKYFPLSSLPLGWLPHFNNIIIINPTWPFYLHLYNVKG